jgi:DNA protecting protein DprA
MVQPGCLSIQEERFFRELFGNSLGPNQIKWRTFGIFVRAVRVIFFSYSVSKKRRFSRSSHVRTYAFFSCSTAKLAVLVAKIYASNSNIRMNKSFLMDFTRVMEEREALLILTHLLKPREIRPLVERMGGVKQVLNHLPWQEKRVWEQDLALVNKSGVRLVSYMDPDYPSNFSALTDPPPILYIKGKIPKASSLAIVGTRICSIYGKECAAKIAEEVASFGMPVVSGLARGIDTAAHVGALRSGETVAFIGSGLGHLYPRENAQLAEEISKKGAVISEFPMNAAPAKHFFPRRNRLIAAFAKGAPYEAPEKAGNVNLEMAKILENLALPCGQVDVASVATIY